MSGRDGTGRSGRRVGVARDRSIQVAHDVLRASIRRGLFGPENLLVEFQLTRSLALGRNAVREALQALADEGVLLRRRGRGTLVARPMLRISTDSVLSFDEGEELANTRVSVRVLARELVEIGELLSATLGLAESTVMLIEAVVCVDSEPICLLESYLPPDVDPDQFAPRFEPVERSFQRFTGEALHTISTAIEAIPADPAAAAVLRVSPGSPLILREQILASRDGAAKLLSFTRYRADRVAFIDSIEMPGHTSDPEADGSNALEHDAPTT